MANALYDKGREKFGIAGINWNSDTIKAFPLSSGYTPSLSTHEFYADVTPASNVIGTPVTLTSKTYALGVMDAADITFSDVANGNSIARVGIMKWVSSASDSPLIGLIDTATGLPVTSNGGAINVAWDNGSNKIFKL